MAKFRYYFFLFGLIASGKSVVLDAQTPLDTTKLHRLEEVEVKTSRPSSFKSTSPLQTLQAKELNKINAMQVSDAAKFFSGAQVKDYGGVGGLKTISLRSLGANYSGISYDGIIVSDRQTGQIDLSRFSLDNVQNLTLSIGESDPIFQTALHRASAGTLTIITSAFQPDETPKRTIKLSLKSGSFGLFNTSLSATQVVNKTFSLNVYGEYLQSEGNYPYMQSYGYEPDPKTNRRTNSDVRFCKLEANLTGKFKNGGKLLLKTNYYDSDRGLPGAVLYYNPYSGERSKDKATFSQLNYTQKLNDLFDFQTNAKFSFSLGDYTDVDNKYPGGKLEARYLQREYYLNATLRYTTSEKWSFSWANDGIYGNFSNSFENCPFPSRTTWLSALSAQFELPRFKLTGSLLNHFTEDRTQIETRKKSRSHLSPYVGFSVKPLENLPVRLRGYFKNTYRLPTFGDMYLSSVPNDDLQPENANQYNAGIVYTTAFNDCFSLLSFSADAYHNRIENKIVAISRGSIYIWSVDNYGKVDINGIDFNLKTQFHWNAGFACLLSATYTYQNVLDKTNKKSQMYNQQLPYTPHHSASGFIQVETPWLDCNYTLLYCGKRYYERINRPEFQMKRYADQGISLVKNIRWRSYLLTLTAECLNLFNAPYEVVHSYPMPGRSFRFGLKFKY
jgi:outer membrane cobalamin receptor